MVACGLHRPIRSDVHHDDLRAGSLTVGADLDGLAEQRVRHRVLPAFERQHRRGHGTCRMAPSITVYAWSGTVRRRARSWARVSAGAHRVSRWLPVVELLAPLPAGRLRLGERGVPPRRRSVTSRAGNTLGDVLCQIGWTTRNRDYADHAQNSTVVTPSMTGPSPK